MRAIILYALILISFYTTYTLNALDVRVNLQTKKPFQLIGGKLIGITISNVTLVSWGEIRTYPLTNIEVLSIYKSKEQLKVASTNRAQVQHEIGVLVPENISTLDRQQIMLAVSNNMIADRSAKASEYYNSTATALKKGEQNLGDIRNQVADMLAQLKEYHNEMNNDPNAEEWKKDQATLEDFLKRYDAGERQSTAQPAIQ